MIELRALGANEIHTGRGIITPSQEIAFAAALYLSLARGKAVSRSKLAQLLWPEASQESRSHRLRQTILQLKRLGLPVRADRNTVQLRHEDVTDQSEIVASAVTGFKEDESLDFLPGYNPGFSAPFREWVETIRNQFQASSVTLLVKRITAARLRADWPQVEQIAAKCLALDPYNEEAVLAKAEAAAMRGSKRAAVSILDQYISEIGDVTPDLKIPASILRRRVAERIPDRPALVTADPPFVGRDKEMTILSQAFDRARAGEGSAVLLLGEPGIGKTRISSELARFAELRGARVQRASCSRADVDRPLSLFVDIVPQLREMPGALGCAPETFSWLRKLTEFELGSDAATRPIETQMLFEHVRAALFDLLESIVEEHCLVVVIEDLQWLDRVSANLLVRMVEWSKERRILFVLNARPGGNAFLEYAEKVRIERIVVVPLAAPASKALLNSVASTPRGELEPEFVDWCLAVAEGNPFFLQELAHQWMETGRRQEAPPSVSKVLHERLSRISSDALQVLQASAVLNEFATLERVERVLGYPPHQLLAAVEELSKAAMLVTPSESSEQPEVRIQPKHDFLASAAISPLSRISLTFLHRRTADVLETELTQKTVSPGLLWACATHRHAAGDTSRAISLRLSCAEHLLELGLAHDACSAFQKTLMYCDSDLDRLSILSQLARAFELAGEWSQSIETLRGCMSLAAKLDPNGDEHNEYELLMLDARQRSALDFATLLEESLSCVNSETASPKHRVGASVVAMKLAVDFGRADYLDQIYGKIEGFLERSDVGELESMQARTIYRTMRGDGMVPIGELQRLAEVARRVDGELGYSRALIVAISACKLSGRYTEGFEFASHALAHATSHRLLSRCREILLSTIALHILADAFDKAKEALDDIHRYPSADSARERNEINAFEARIALEEGDYTRAAAAFAKIETVSPLQSVSRRGFYLALELRIRIEERVGPEVIQSLVAQLETMHLQMRGLGSQDFECYSLCLGLCVLKQEYRAARLLSENAKQRRANCPIPSWLGAAINRPELQRAEPSTTLVSEVEGISQ